MWKLWKAALPPEVFIAMVKELLDDHRGTVQSTLAVLMRGVDVSSHTRPQTQVRCGRANVWVVDEGRNGHRVREMQLEEMTEGYIYSGDIEDLMGWFCWSGWRRLLGWILMERQAQVKRRVGKLSLAVAGAGCTVACIRRGLRKPFLTHGSRRWLGVKCKGNRRGRLESALSGGDWGRSRAKNCSHGAVDH